MQWIQDPSQSNVDILNNVRREVSRHFRNKKKTYLRAKIEELETNSKIQNIRDLYRGINDFTKGYQPRCNIVKDEKSDLVADFHSIVARWRNYFSQLFNVHGVKDVGQAQIHTAEPLVPDPNASEFELSIDKLKSHKSPGIERILAELIKVGGRTICLEIHKLSTSVWKKEKLPEEWKELIILPIHRKGIKQIVIIIGAKEIIRDHQCGFRRNRSTIDHVFCISLILEKEWEYNEEVHQL